MEDGGDRLVVGQRIRVLPATADGLARRALILSFDGSDLIEIEYEKAEGAEEVVLRKRCQPLLPFEEKTGSAAAAADAETLKLNGNTLFKLRDAAAAIEQYVAGLKLLSEAPSAGARCLVRPADNPHGAVRSAYVLTVEDDGKAVDLTYEPDAFGKTGVSGEGGVPQRLQALLRAAERMDNSGGGGHSSHSRGGRTAAAAGIESRSSDGQSGGSGDGGGSGGSSWWPSGLLGSWRGGGGDGSGVADDEAAMSEAKEGEGG